MPYVALREYFPEIADRETRTIVVRADATVEQGLPTGHYHFVELFCDEVGCDCRRVFFTVLCSFRKEIQAVVAWGWEDPGFYAKWMRSDDPRDIESLKGPNLNMGSPETELAPGILELARTVLLLDADYVARVKSHYARFREKVDGHSRRWPGNESTTKESTPAAGPSVRKVGRDEPCPCGSGKKYKKCCIEKEEGQTAVADLGDTIDSVRTEAADAAHVNRPRPRSPRRRNDFSRILQFKITLKETSPPIWRRILVAETYSFWDLHIAVQDAMGWQDYHLHVFEMRRAGRGKEKRIGIPDEEWQEEFPTLPGWKQAIADWFTLDHPTAAYEYDFGDSWEHEVELERILPREPGQTYPSCIGGELLAPPEDVGGVHGHYDFLEAVRDVNHAEHDDWLTWAGGSYDPQSFDSTKVTFDDPDERRSTPFKTMGEEI